MSHKIDEELESSATDYADRNSMPEDYFNNHHDGLFFGFKAGAKFQEERSRVEIEKLKDEKEAIKRDLNIILSRIQDVTDDGKVRNFNNITPMWQCLRDTLKEFKNKYGDIK